MARDGKRGRYMNLYTVSFYRGVLLVEEVQVRAKQPGIAMVEARKLKPELATCPATVRPEKGA
jgi:hypothetical protein